MNKLIVILVLLLSSLPSFSQHNAGTKGKILMIVSNPAVSKQTNWPIGVWYSELTHPYWIFSENGYAVDIASLDGGEIKFDSFSDPEDESGYAAFDYISLGFKKDPNKVAIIKNSIKLSAVNPHDYKAIFVCGGQGPMYTMYRNKEIEKFFSDFYETGKPSAAICHGTCILLTTKGSNGKLLVEGKKWTGFASSEEQYADNYVGMKIQPFRIEDEAKKIPNTTFVTGHPFEAFAVKDGNLITGQQQNSGAAAATLVIDELEKQKQNYPTYVLVHGAWADESAWGFVRNSLAVNANVEVINLPAHGIDLTDAAKVSLSDYVETVENRIRNYKGKVILVGHSMAGIIISQVAENMPDKIDKLIYVSAYLPKNGEDILSLSKKDKQSLVGNALQFNTGYTAATIKKDVIAPAVCADCPDYMKDILVKYHKEEPVKPLGDKVTLTKVKFGSIPKYYIHTTNDKAVGYALQQQMVKDNGGIKETFMMNTSHLPFVVKPDEFVAIIKSIK
ncbi:alpha/beta fold hydrolase [Flavobacterium sp. D11R37]|uniref:alpha/beta fold hydrolase n=1 Tax=Flavobacterium coralii TaxID=2838017 RepID=UPI001CA775F2|nr:alpha/beta fold hydrolase [Flavobacterium coralii]MBY8962876.1 alpha/beta fold hydrolase [Flavobacterium coralii]